MAVNWTFTFNRRDEIWEAYCEELGTATFAPTLREAKALLKEMVELHLQTLEDVGEKERFFREHNIGIHSV